MAISTVQPQGCKKKHSANYQSPWESAIFTTRNTSYLQSIFQVLFFVHNSVGIYAILIGNRIAILIGNLQEKKYSDKICKVVWCEGLQKPFKSWIPHCHCCFLHEGSARCIFSMYSTGSQWCVLSCSKPTLLLKERNLSTKFSLPSSLRTAKFLREDRVEAGWFCSSSVPQSNSQHGCAEVQAGVRKELGRHCRNKQAEAGKIWLTPIWSVYEITASTQILQRWARHKLVSLQADRSVYNLLSNGSKLHT